MSAPLFKSDTKVRLLQERFDELNTECHLCLAGLSTDSANPHASTQLSIDPKAITHFSEFCAETLRIILDTLRQLNSEHLHLQGVTLPTNLPKPLKIIVQKYAEFHHSALTDRDPRTKAQMERLCQFIIEHANRDILIPCKNELKRCGALDNHFALQETLRHLSESFPTGQFKTLCQ